MPNNNRSSTQAIASFTGGTALLALVLLAIRYPDRAIFHEHPEGIPHRKGWPIVGALPTILASREKLHDALVSTFEELDTLTFSSSSIGTGRRIMTIHPDNIEHFLKHNFANYVKGPEFQSAMMDLLGHGIFNANGEQWKYQRKTASFIFNVKNFRDHFTEYVQGYYHVNLTFIDAMDTSVFVEELQFMTKNIFDMSASKRSVIDLHDIMFKFTLDSFVRIGFGVDIQALGSKEKVPFAESFDICQMNSSWRFAFPAWRLSEPLKRTLMPWRKSVQDHLRVIDDFAYGVIRQRRDQLAQGMEFKDLLSRFMNTRDENGQPLSDQALRDIILNFIIAGRDTTAQALSWTFYNLMLHPRVEAKLLQEIKEHVPMELENDSPALYEAIKGMNYAHAVLYEVLRLYPSVPNNLKYALEDDVWPDGTHVKAGDYVAWSTYALGRSIKVWGPDAKQFKPERWLTPEGDLRRESQGQWPVFHVGPRVCLGQHLATLESLVTIVFLLRRYSLSLLPEQDITYQTSLTMPMKYGMKVFVEQR